MANESDVQLFSGGTGPLLRTINVQTYIGGQLTTVQMEVAAIADAMGNVFDFATLDQQNRQIVRELKAIKRILLQGFGVLTDADEEI